jgi:hypothetical protein
MLAAAGEREASAHTVATGHPQGLSGRGDSGRCPDLEVGIHGPPNFVVQESRDVSTIAVDHGAPADRAVSHGQGLKDAKLGERIEFRTAPRARHGHAENASVLHGMHEGRGDTASLLDLVAQGADGRRQRDGGMQDRGLVEFCLPCRIRHGWHSSRWM